jgi:anti-sigma-K factor RskA
MTEETPDILAAEYVLGTLDADERAQVQALIESDPVFARLVRNWERRLGELHAMVDAVEPPPETWQRIRFRIGAGNQREPLRLPELPPPPPEPTNVVDLRARLARWRGAASGLGALAAVLFGIVVMVALAPRWLPPPLRPKPERIEVVRVETRPAEPSAPARFVAVLQRDAASPAFILTVDVTRRYVVVRRLTAEQPAGKSYELWLVSDRFAAPRSLGLVGTDDFTAAPALASYDSATVRGATYAVSLEPEGGSPTGAPTGPVVFSGKLVEAVPPQ